MELAEFNFKITLIYFQFHKYPFQSLLSSRVEVECKKEGLATFNLLPGQGRVHPTINLSTDVAQWNETYNLIDR